MAEIKNSGAFDIFGNIALVKFPEKESRITSGKKKKFAEKLLKENKSVTTVLEKVGRFKGRLRKQETRWIAGEKTKEVLYRENGCVFRFNIDDTYFSPRLSSERKDVSEKIKKGDSVLVMFAGVGPFPIVIAKNSKAEIVYSNEINRKANKYAEQNIDLNKLKGRVVLLPGDVKRISKIISCPPFQNLASLSRRFNGSEPTLSGSSLEKNDSAKIQREEGILDRSAQIPTAFDVIVMPRPRLKDSFLSSAFALSKKGTRIFYYDFCKDDEIDSVVEKVREKAKEFRKKIKILGVKKAGEIAPYKFRVRVDFNVL